MLRKSLKTIQIQVLHSSLYFLWCCPGNGGTSYVSFLLRYPGVLYMTYEVIDPNTRPVIVKESTWWAYKPIDFFEPWGTWHHIVVNAEEIVHNGKRRRWTQKPEEDILELFDSFEIDTVLVAGGVKPVSTGSSPLSHVRTGGFDLWHMRIYNNISVCQKLMLHEKDFHQIQVKAQYLY